MTKTRKLSLIAATILLSALSLPRSSTAQTLEGSYAGVEYYDTSVYQAGTLISSLSGWTTANLYIDGGPGNGLSMYILGQPPASDVFGQGTLSPPDAFGPTSATGSLFLDAGPGGLVVGNFFLTYESILPNGQIDVGNGGAVADLTTTSFFFPSPQDVTVSFASFTSVPEPSSIVPAALAVLVIGVIAWIRCFRQRLRVRPS
jgi:hypothetical protein